MKKNLEKIFASASIIVAVILIMVLIITAFGGIKFEEFESELVRGLLITLAILYFVLAGVALTLMFVNNDVLKDVIIRTETGGSVRVSAKVITRMIKKACAEIEGLKCKKVVLVQDDYGVRLKTNVKIVDKDVVETETYLRTLLEDMFFGEFGFKFESIEIKVMVLTPKYKSDKEAINAIVAEKVAEIRAKDEVNAPQHTAEKAETKSAEKKAEEPTTHTDATDDDDDVVYNAYKSSTTYSAPTIEVEVEPSNKGETNKW